MDDDFEDLSEIIEDDTSLECGHESHEYDVRIGRRRNPPAAASNDPAIMDAGIIELEDLEGSHDSSFHIFGRGSSQDESSVPILPSAAQQQHIRRKMVQPTEPTTSIDEETKDEVARTLQFDSLPSSSEGSSSQVYFVGDVMSDISDEGNNTCIVDLADEPPVETSANDERIHTTTSWSTSDIESIVSSTNAHADSREHLEDEWFPNTSPATFGLAKSPVTNETESQSATRTIATQTSRIDDDDAPCTTPDATKVNDTDVGQRPEPNTDVTLYDMMMDHSMLSDIESQRTFEVCRSTEDQNSPVKEYAIVDTDSGLDLSQNTDNSTKEVVIPEPKQRKKKKAPKPLKMGRERRHKRKSTEIKHPLQTLDLLSASTKSVLPERNAKEYDMDLLDSQSNLSDEETGDDAMAWSGTLPWGLGDDLTRSSEETTDSEVMEQRLRLASFVFYHVTSHWPQLVAILYWDRSPSVYAAPWIFGIVAMRWCGRQQRRRSIATATIAAVGYAIWASADLIHSSLVFIGLLLASVYEPRFKPNPRLRQGSVVVSYLLGGLLFETTGKVGLGAFGATLLVINVGVLYALDKSEKKRIIASESTSRLSIIVSSEVLPTILEGEEKATLASVLQTCSVSAVHGLITTTIPWLVLFEYGWTNVMHLGGLFAIATALAIVVPSAIPPRFATYALTYAALSAGLPYRWPFVVGFLLLPSCMKAAPKSSLVDSTDFGLYWLAASSSPLLFIVFPQAPAVVACCIAFAASIVDFLSKTSLKAALSDPMPPAGLHALQKTLF